MDQDTRELIQEFTGSRRVRWIVAAGWSVVGVVLCVSAFPFRWIPLFWFLIGACCIAVSVGFLRRSRLGMRVAVPISIAIGAFFLFVAIAAPYPGHLWWWLILGPGVLALATIPLALAGFPADRQISGK